MLPNQNINFFDVCFSGLSEERKKHFSEKMEKLKFSKGQYIYKADEDATDVFFLQKGSAREVKHTIEGDEIFIWYCEIGEAIGLYNVFSNGPHWDSVIANEPCEVLRMSREDFLEMAKSSTTALEAILQDSSAIIKEEELNKLDIVNHTTFERLAKYVVALYKRNLYKEFTLPKLKHVGDYLNMTVQELSRKLKELEEKGYMDRSHRTVHKLDIDKMKKELNIF